MKGLERCLETCVEAATSKTWNKPEVEYGVTLEAVRDEFLASFMRFIGGAQQTDEQWKTGIAETMRKFLECADLLLHEKYERVMEVRSRLVTGIQDEDRQDAEREKNKAHRQKLIQQTMEYYMLLVNASFVSNYENEYMNVSYKFMSGLEFPGLWSRSLYEDPTPKKIYRNMLVGCRPYIFGCDDKFQDGWVLMLYCVRMVINNAIPQAERGLLTEYETNLRYTHNWVANAELGYLAPYGNGVVDVDTWTVPLDSGFIKYDVKVDQLILPQFMGTPCGALFSNGYIYMLTTEGEIFRLQLERMVNEAGRIVSRTLLRERTKCIVEAPNQCIITRVHFDKGTDDFPALVHVWEKDDFEGLKPTSLVTSARDNLLLVDCNHRVIWEIVVGGSNTDTRPNIRLHAGQPLVWRQNYRITARERGKGDENQDSVEFNEPRCAVFDANNDLWVCDRDWLRKITYDKNDPTRRKFIVSNEANLRVMSATSIAMGIKGFVVLEHYWDMAKGTTWKPRLLDVQWLNLEKDGKIYKEIRKSSYIKNLGPRDIGSIILDRKDQVIFCPRNEVRAIDRAPFVWVGYERDVIPCRADDQGTDDVVMVNLAHGACSTCHLTWYRSRIALFTKPKNGGPILTLLGEQPKRAAGGAADGDEAAREVRPRTGADRPQTAPPGRGGGRGETRAQDLLLQLAELCV